jgi:hypothetical protein
MPITVLEPVGGIGANEVSAAIPSLVNPSAGHKKRINESFVLLGAAYKVRPY